jgi:integrase
MARWDDKRGCYRITAEARRPDGSRSRIVRDVKFPKGVRGLQRARDAEGALRAEVGATSVEAGSFAEYAALWLDRAGVDTRPWSPRSAALHAQVMRDYVLPHIGRYPLADLARDRGPVVDMFAAWSRTPGRKGDVVSPAVIRRWGSIVRAVFASALKDGRINRNPVVGAMPGGPAAEKLIPSPEEVRDLFEAARSPDARLFFRIAAGTGARRGSIRMLAWRDVDFDGASITFRVTKMSAPYSVAIDAGLLAELREARHRAAATALATAGVSGRIADRYVFTSDPDGARPWTESAASHAFVAAAERVGLADGITLHSLRHFHATRLLAAGRPSKEVATRLGCTESNVIRTYSHLVTSNGDREAADLIGRLLA